MSSPPFLAPEASPPPPPMAALAPAPSPMSPATAADHSPFKPSSLPVMALREKILEKVAENRVTLIIGDTGCGKSSQVPQFFLDENECSILCTQPRRFAVVAIARTVASARNCELGDEVGFHIGHSKKLSARSKLVFKTAGVLLDEMLDKGIDALNYKVIILDEVHERSVESDLVLACVKQFLVRKPNLRLVLMSATADITRYRDYFKDLGRGERVEVIAIPSSSRRAIFQRRVLYLEQISELLGKNLETMEIQHQSAVKSSAEDATIKPDLLNYIRDLVLHIHENEHDIEKSILVFLPTYMSLEQQWSLLQPHSLSFFHVHILHSSIDIQKALMSMKISKHARKVILATNIAESSVTIPGVAYVIDSCRSLQVFWDFATKRETSELVWISKSQAEQRKGRTGRTCDGEVYRLVNQTFYNNLSDHEQPSILRLSLRHQVLAICSSESRAINDPKVLMQKALDPPNEDVVEDALNLLVSIHALEKSVSQRGRHEPTYYGRLLASLRLSFDASLLALKIGSMGHFREGILLGILVDLSPLPIIQPFGDNVAFAKNIGNFFHYRTNEGAVTIGKKEVIYMANLCAFQYWQRVFKINICRKFLKWPSEGLIDKQRLEHLKHTLSKDVEPTISSSAVFKVEEEWCLVHNLIQTSLHQISDMYDDVLDALHRFRPNFFAGSHDPPSCYEPYNFNHVCHFQEESTCFLDGETSSQCLSVPYISADDFDANVFSEKLVAAAKEIRMQQMGQQLDSQYEYNVDSTDTNEPSLCMYFAKGSCIWGSECHFSHSLQAKKPMCKFFFSLQGCRNGDYCHFSHSEGPSTSSPKSPFFCFPEDEDPSLTFSELLPSGGDVSFLVVDDDPPCSFSSSLSNHCDSVKIISTTSQDCKPDFLPPENVTILWGCSHLSQLIVEREGMNIPWDNVKCVLWTLKFTAYEENLEALRLHVQSFFQHLAIKLLADTLYDVRLVLTINNIRYGQIKVEKIARDCFFHLEKSCVFDESTFGNSGYQCSKKPMQVSRPVSYIFDLHPPSDIQFGDYSTALRKGLNLTL